MAEGWPSRDEGRGMTVQVRFGGGCWCIDRGRGCGGSAGVVGARSVLKDLV